MVDPTHRTTEILRRSALAVRGGTTPNEAIASLLALARELLGFSTAMVVEVIDDVWRAVHVDDGAFDLVPGTTLPLADTF